MKFINAIDMRFPEKKKEVEYMATKRKNIDNDFHATMIFLIAFVLSTMIERFLYGYILRGIIPGITVAVLLGIYIVRLFLKKATLYILLALIFAYDTYKLVMLRQDSKSLSWLALFFSGYSYAILQMMLISRLPYMTIRILVVAICYGLRYAIFILIVDNGGIYPGLYIRGAFLDIFLLYYFYSEERIHRSAFMTLDKQREELLKFKELLASSFPLAITVVDLDTLKPLFSNSAVFNLFSCSHATPNLSSNQQNGIQRNANIESTSYLDSLYGDETTIREIGEEQPNIQAFNRKNNYVCLKEVLKSLLQSSLLVEKTICLTASFRDQENPKSFNVIIRKIMWNGKDAIAVIFNDITYQEKLIYWKMANANKDKVIATVSHELRTPLNGILGLLEMAENKIEQPDALEYISLCKDNAHLLLSLVNSMLDLHQISAGKLKLNISGVDIRKCIKSVLQLFHFQTNQKGIYLTFSVGDDVSENIKTDENRLKQIIINLIGNAIKFTSEGGIKVIVANDETEPSFLKISVLDTGMGIKDEDRCKLFQMYGKLDDTKGINKGGVGLGLTISNALAGILSGKKEEKEIQVTSKYGEGTIFSFNILKDLKTELILENPEKRDNKEVARKNPPLKYDEYLERIDTEENLLEKSIGVGNEFSIQSEDLPSKLKKYQTLDICSTLEYQFPISPTKDTIPKVFIEKDQKLKVIRPCSIGDQLSIKKLSSENINSREVHLANNLHEKSYILIVDDNPFNLLVAENLVKETGYNVKTTMGGFEAIKQMEKFHQEGTRVKVILMDCQMPVIDGYETTKILLGMMEEGKVDKVPIIAMTANNSHEDIERCKESGMVGHLTKPATKQELIKVLKES